MPNTGPFTDRDRAVLEDYITEIESILDTMDSVVENNYPSVSRRGLSPTTHLHSAMYRARAQLGEPIEDHIGEHPFVVINGGRFADGQGTVASPMLLEDDHGRACKLISPENSSGQVVAIPLEYLKRM
jgi:hypothetical protein